jgi:hypothetical protein
MDFDLIKNQLKNSFLEIGIPEEYILEITDDEIMQACDVVHAHIVNPIDYVKDFIRLDNFFKHKINLNLFYLSIFLQNERVENRLSQFSLYHLKRLYWRSLIRSPTI